MSGALAPQAQPLVLGANHRISGVDLRARLLPSAEAAETLLRRILAETDASEGLVLSTCNRCDIHLVSLDPEGAARRARALWAEAAGLDLPTLQQHTYLFVGDDAVRHLFRVACSLDSQVIGESQILGQVRDAYQAAAANGTLGYTLQHLFQQAIRVGKRARAETPIAEGAVSISFAAVELARKVVGSLADKCVGVLGSGEMGTLAAEHLHKCRAGRFLVFNRSLGPAEALAARLGGEARPLDEIETHLPACDLLIAAIDAGHHVLTRQQVQSAMRQRPERRMFLIDISVPRGIAPAAGTLSNVYLFTLDDLRQVVRENEARRQAATQAVADIIEAEQAALAAWNRGQRVRPTLQSLQRHHAALLQREVEQARPASAAEAERLERFGQALLQAFLHAPISTLKRLGAEGEGPAAARFAEDLFGLPPSPSTSTPATPESRAAEQDFDQ